MIWTGYNVSVSGPIQFSLPCKIKRFFLIFIFMSWLSHELSILWWNRVLTIYYYSFTSMYWHKFEVDKQWTREAGITLPCYSNYSSWEVSGLALYLVYGLDFYVIMCIRRSWFVLSLICFNWNAEAGNLLVRKFLIKKSSVSKFLRMYIG